MTENNTGGTEQDSQVSEMYPDGNKVQMEKAKKNLVYVGIMSVVMLFAGFTSAYIVSMGDSFWLKFPLPSFFWVSTVVILLSSITIQMAVIYVKKGNIGGLKLMVSLTLLLGIIFAYSQIRGYGQLVDNGIHPSNNHIIVTDGKYGDYFEVKYKGDFIEINGNDYLIKGEKMSEGQILAYQGFMAQFLEVKDEAPFKVEQYGKDFVLYFENIPMELKDGQLKTPEGDVLEYLDRVRLSQLAVHVRDRRGDFFVRGELGKDFHIYFKGKELQYKDRELQMNGTKLTDYLQIKSMEAADTASSYLYLITFVHLLHVVVALMYMIKIVIRSFSGKINAEHNVSLSMGAIFWHFLGILWLYLLFFLLYIH